MSDYMDTYNEEDGEEYDFVFEGFEGMEGDDESEIVSQPQTVSGVGIANTPAESDISLDDMLKNLNAQNSSVVEAETARQQKEQEAREEEDRKKRQQAKDKILRERYEKEKEEREKIRQREEEEERRLEEEALAKRQASPLYKLKKTAGDLAEKQREMVEKKKKEKEEKEVEKKAKEIPAEEQSVKEKPDAKKAKKSKDRPQKNSKTPDFEYLATHDKLTGMKNLTAYEMASKNLNPKNAAILFFDVNDLKLTNDTLGHNMGNKLIMKAASTLDKLFPEKTYRIGGDEFVVLLSTKENDEKSIQKKIADFQNMMDQATKDDTEGIVYSVSVGYALGDGKKTISEIQDEADKAMYEQKRAYKEKQKERARANEKEKVETEKPDHDALLPSDQRMLKEVIRENHSQASEESTEKILREIQSRHDEILAVLVASPTFDHLFIMQDVDSFISLVIEMDNLIDYSYLYVVYENGTQFYGIDEYFDEVTELFKEIGNALKNARFLSEKELLKIKGINIFKNIYFD